MINLMPEKLRLSGHCVRGTQYVKADSLLLLFASMQVENARTKKGKPEYHDLLDHLKDVVSTLDFS